MAGKFLDDLVFKVIADTKGAVEGLSKVGDKAQELNRHSKSTASGMEAMFGKIKVGAAVAVAAVAAVGVSLGALALKAATAAAENEESQRRLALTLKNVTGATQESADAMNDWITQVSLAYGITTSNLTPAMDQLIRATRDAASAQKVLALAMDVSAGTGIDLQTVSVALGEAYKGNYSQLGRLKTGISESALASKDFKTITAELATMFDGQADLAANTFQGSLNRMGTAFQNLQENLGTMLIPVFQLLINIVNKALVPAIRNFIVYMQKHPEVVEKMVRWTAIGINFFKDFAKIILYVGDAFFQLLSLLARVVQGFGWLTGQKGLKDWGRNTAESLLDIASALDAVGDKLDKFDAQKYIPKLDFSNVKLPDLLPGITGGITGGGGGGESAKLASDWQNAAKAILQALKQIKKSFDDITGLNIKDIIKNLSGDPLVLAMNRMKKAAQEYSDAQADLIKKIRLSTIADLEYVKSMKDVTEAGKARTAALREEVEKAKDAAIEAANVANDALQRIAEAQQQYVDELINRIKSLRDAFKQATQVSFGGLAGSISGKKQNVENARKNLAEAEKAYADAQAIFKQNIAAEAYANVITNLAMPSFEAEKKAIEQAREDLAQLLEETKNPYAATAQELQDALQDSYNNAVELSQVAGDLAAAGFSQDFITQILESGPDIALELGKSILAADPETRASLNTLFENLQTVSNSGVDQLSIDLNQGAIDAMDQFVQGLATVKEPLEQVMKMIEDRILAMIKTIMDAILALMALLGGLGKGGGGGGGKTGIASVDAYGGTIEEYRRTRADEREDPGSYARSVNVTVNVDKTDASVEEIASSVAFAVRTGSDATYAYGGGI